MSKTGRPRKPSALHELHGTETAKTRRARDKEPLPPSTSLPAPAYLTAEQKADWDFAVKNAPAGVLFACDKAALEVFIVASDHHRIANEQLAKFDATNEHKLLIQTSVVTDKNGKQKAGGNIIANPYLNIIANSGARILRAAAELGFTPAARPRLSGQVFDPAMMPTRVAPDGKAVPGQRKPPAPTKTEESLNLLMASRASIN